MSDKQYQLRTLSRALDVLTLLRTSPEALTMTAIADRMGDAAPVIFRVLKTLEAKGFIHRVGDSKRYAPSDAHDQLGVARLLVRVLHKLSSQPQRTAENLQDELNAEPNSIAMVLGLLRESHLAVVSIDGAWSLSPHLPELVRSQSTADLVDAAQPVMERLQEQTGETVALFVRNGASQVVLHVLNSRHPLRYALEVGSVFPVNRGAAGKASLAWLDETEIRFLLDDPALAGEAIDIPLLLKELQAVRARGFATSYGERIVGAAAVSAPITDRDGNIRCVMAVTGPASRISPETQQAHGAALRSELIDAGLLNEPESARFTIQPEVAK